MEEKLYLVILDDTYTARKLHKRLRVLKSYLLMKIFGSVGEQIDQVEMDEEQEWFQDLDSDLLSQITKDNLYTIFTNLETKIKNIPLLSIYLAFDMPKDEVTRVGKELRKQYGPTFLFDIRFDPNIIAGAALSWGGIYKDYSVRSLIDQRKNEILTTFRNFVGRKV